MLLNFCFLGLWVLLWGSLAVFLLTQRLLRFQASGYEELGVGFKGSTHVGFRV